MGLMRRMWQWLTDADGDAVDDCCRRGHRFTEANTYMRPDGRGRECRACRRDRGLNRKFNTPGHGHESKEG